MQLIVLGSGAGGPFQGRNYTAQLFKVDNHIFLIDCGEGTQHQLFRYRLRYDHMKEIFISHLHGDHVFGLMGLLTSFALKKRSAPLAIFGPVGLRELVETSARLVGAIFPFIITVHEVDTTISTKVFENDKVEVSTIPLNHRTLCTGWLFKEKLRPANILAEKIQEYGIPYTEIAAIKAGADYHLPNGVIIAHTELTTPPSPPRSFAFCSDTAPSDTVIAAVKGVNLLYHEATFTNDHEAEAAYSGHSTAEQAAFVAREAGVGQLLIGHFSGRYRDVLQHLEEARAIFQYCNVVEEGREYEI